MSSNRDLQYETGWIQNQFDIINIDFYLLEKEIEILEILQPAPT